jgi:hypothetical protein
MTINKSLISIAAATLLAASFVGCSSDSDSTYVPAATAVTSLTATDGYVLNYTASAIVSDGNESNNTRITVALPTAVTNASIVAGSTQTAGSPTLDLTKDLTTAQIANLVSVNLAYKAQSTNGTTLTYGTFFDANGDSKFVAADGDTLAPSTFAMSAPVGYKNITPITTLVAARIATLTASDTNDTNRSAVEALALTQIAAGLGLKSDDIKNVDPINTVATNPAYQLINSMLGDATAAEMTTLATSLSTATAPTTVSAALTNIAASGISTAARFTSAATQLSADADMINSVSTWNLDKMRAAGVTFIPQALTPSNADFNVTAITMNGNATSGISGSGAKIDATDLDLTKIAFTSSADKNVTNKPLVLVMRMGAQQLYRAADANISSLTISIPMDINNTIGATKVIDAAVSGNVKWEGINNVGTTFSGEMNATEFGTRVSTAMTMTTGTMNIAVDDIFTAIDVNASLKFGYTPATITDLKIALVDSGSALQLVTGTTPVTSYWGNTAVASVSGGINATGKTILNNSLTDGRAALVAVANKAPQSHLTVTSVVGTVTNGITGDVAATPIIIENNSRVNVILSSAVTDTMEKNNTVAFAYSGLTGIDLNATGLNTLYTAAAATAGASTTSSDINITESSVQTDQNMTVTVTNTDEFKEANATKYYFIVNRAPVYNTPSTLLTEVNSTTSSKVSLLKDLDNTTANIQAAVWVNSDVNNTYMLLTSAFKDFNLTSSYACPVRISDDNKSMEFNITKANLDLNLTSSYDLNITFSDVNDTYGSVRTDSNVTKTLTGN